MSTKPRTSQQKHVRPPPPPPSAGGALSPRLGPVLRLGIQILARGLRVPRGLDPFPTPSSPAQPPPGCRP